MGILSDIFTIELNVICRATHLSVHGEGQQRRETVSHILIMSGIMPNVRIRIITYARKHLTSKLNVFHQLFAMDS